MTMTGAIVMAVYRPDPELLERQIDSLRAQTIRDWTCVIGLDGRDEDTERLLHHLVDSDPRFEVHTFADNVGVYKHFERLLERVPATSDWIALADQDDHWYPEKFSRMVPELAEPGVMAVIGDANVVDRTGVRRGQTRRCPGDLVSTILRNQMTGSLALIRGDVVRNALPFPPSTTGAIHDHWLAVCAAAMGRIVRLDQVVQDYVQHESNVIGEVQLKGVSDVVRETIGIGGPLRYLDDFVAGPWTWRRVMATAVLTRGVPQESRPVLEHLSDGRLGAPGAKAVLRDLGHRRISPVAAVGMFAASMRTAGLEKRRREPQAD